MTAPLFLLMIFQIHVSSNASTSAKVTEDKARGRAESGDSGRERNAVIRPQEPAADRMDFFNGLLRSVESQQLSRPVNVARFVVTDDVFCNRMTSLTREAVSMVNTNLPAITRSRLVSDLTKLGIASGDTLMLHASVKAAGWIVGGPDVVLRAILDVLGSTGTLMMYVKCEEQLNEIEDWPEDWQKAYLEECPPFDPSRTRAFREWSILTEYLRTWPGARCSAHPEARVAAVGARADWITSDHPLQFGYGADSPLEKLCEVRGKILLLGPLFDSLTILHYAEHIADVPNKRTERYRWPVLRGGKCEWIEFEQFDTSNGIVDWPDGSYFQSITKAYMARGRCAEGRVGTADSYLFDARDLADFAIAWLEEQFG